MTAPSAPDDQLQPTTPDEDPVELACRLHEDALALSGRGEYDEAEALFRRAVELLEESEGPEHPDVANVLGGLAELLSLVRRDSEAEAASRRALAITEAVLGDETLELAEEDALAVRQIRQQSLTVLGTALRLQGRYTESEPYLERALAEAEEIAGNEHVEVAISHNNLGVLYKYWGKFDEAECRYQKAREILECAEREIDDPAAAAAIHYNLGGLRHARGLYREAEPFARRALALRREALGDTHPEVAVTRGTLGTILEGQGRLEEAESLYREALAGFERAYGPEHPDVALTLHNLASVTEAQGDDPEAERLLRRALALREKLLGENHPQVGTTSNNLAHLLARTSRRGEAEALYRRALEILERACGAEHPDTCAVRENLAALGR